MKKYLLYALMVIVAVIIFVLVGRELFKDKPAHFGHEASSEQEAEKLYRCPMIQDNYFSDKPGKCPKCGMDLILVPKDETVPSGVSEYSTIKLTSEKQQLIGMRKDKVMTRPLSRTVRAVGTIGYNERKVSDVNVKFGGWIDVADSGVTAGKFVKEGAPLFSIFSPELVTAQQEFLSALEAVKKAEEIKSVEMTRNAVQMAEATRQRLVFWDITDDQIDRIAQEGKPSKTLWMSAKAEGFIIGDELANGKYIAPGELVFKIADLSTVWIDTEIYEFELTSIGVDDKAVIELSAYPGERFEGRLKYIYPNVNPVTRTIKARIELQNTDYKLKIGMYADVTMTKELGEKLVISAEAVMDTGKRQVVFVDKGDGFFEPREVKLGVKTDSYYEVMSGVSEGETVVTSGNFFIDSESKLKAATSTMGTGHAQHGEAGEKK